MGLQPVGNTAYSPRACTSAWLNHRSNAGTSCHSLKSGSRCLEGHRAVRRTLRRDLRMSSSAEGASSSSPAAAKHHQQPSNTDDATSMHYPCCRRSCSGANNTKDVDVPAVLAMAICSFAAALAPLTITFPAIAASSDFSIASPSALSSPGNPIAEVSGLFGLGSSDNEDDPIDPFTLYGVV